MLNIKDLTARYGHVLALDNISLSAGSNEFVGVIGSNRAGKSTLLKSISGLVPERSGLIEWNARDLSHLPAHEIPHHGVAHVPEGRQLFREMTVEENLIVGSMTADSRKRRAEGLERTYELFPRLKERRRQLAGTMSGGEQQMLAIGRALMLQPKLLLLDEPSMGLAPRVVQEVYDRIRQVRQLGLAVVLVEQNMHVALDTVDRCYVLENGRVALEGTAEEIRNNPQVREAYLGI